MKNGKLRHADVLVVGAGPAGLAAAIGAAKNKCSVIVLDANPTPGGQIWRTSSVSAETESGKRRTQLLHDFQASGSELLSGRTVIDVPANQVLRTVTDTEYPIRTEDFAWQRLILATGARERFLPFPGWTLPGVFGAGGLQALVRGGLPVRGRRVLLAGSGPLLFAVSRNLKQSGAKIIGIVEQASRPALLKFAASLLRHPAKLLQGAGYGAAGINTPWYLGWWPLRASRTPSGLSVQLTNSRQTVDVSCDYLACGFHLVPNIELPLLLGCSTRHGHVHTDALQQTSIANILCAGEPTAIAGLESALVQGTIAGLMAANHRNEAEALSNRRKRESSFGSLLDKAFRLRPELAHLAEPETIVCRCEDVTFAQMKNFSSWTSAKLQTRCGMGACQARICGPIAKELFGWGPASVRPPLYPVPLSTLGDQQVHNPILKTESEEAQ